VQLLKDDHSLKYKHIMKQKCLPLSSPEASSKCLYS
jgi:hypothetical protein